MAGGTRLGAVEGDASGRSRAETCATRSETVPPAASGAGPVRLAEGGAARAPSRRGPCSGSGSTTATTRPRRGPTCRRSRCCSPSSWSSITGPSGEVVRPGYTEELDYEGELAVVIGRTARDVPGRTGPGPRLRLRGDERPLRARPPARRAPVDPREGRRRASPRSAPGSPPPTRCPTLRGCPSAPGSTAICARTAPPATWSSRSPTSSPSARPASPCGPGDVITTGTPAGVGVARDPKAFLQPGDRVRVEIPELGVLEHAIR